MQIEPQCFDCKNYINKDKCKAFKKIPEDIIITGEFDHTKKHPKQNNDILFESITKE